MTSSEYLGYATQLLSDLGLLGAITALGVIMLAIAVFRFLTSRNG